MKAALQPSSQNNLPILFASLSLLLFIASANADTQLILSRGAQPDGHDYKGVIELSIDPGFDDARVALTVDGQKIAESLQFPYKLTVDFGPTAMEHKIDVVATRRDKHRVQWHSTINRGHLPLSVNVTAIDTVARTFEARTTAPDDDPVVSVSVWDDGKLVTAVDRPPFRFTVPPAVFSSGFVQVTAKAKSGEEAADFWSIAGDVHVEAIQVRTVPIFVSVVDRNGNTRDDVDRSLFRIIDGVSEAKIVEFGKAFDQPISIALLVDASASMTYTMSNVTRAALAFAKNTLRPGDRCSVFAVQDVPRRMQELTTDSTLVEKALTGIRPRGETSLYDAIASALRELRNEKNRRAVVVLTDGADNASISTYNEIKAMAAEAGVPLYFVAYDTGGDDVARHLDELKNLAAETGGFVATANEQTLAQKYRDIEKDLRAQFAILYQITDYAKPNQWRPIRVVMASPKLVARTIRGYFAP